MDTVIVISLAVVGVVSFVVNHMPLHWAPKIMRHLVEINHQAYIARDLLKYTIER